MDGPRLHIPGPLAPGGEITLDAAATAHLRARRVRAGDALSVFTGTGGEYAAEILRVERRRALLRIGSFRDVERESPLPTRLLQGISKGERMDWTIRKAVELGVHAIHPLFAERSVPAPDAARLERRMEHWRGVIASACEQCGRNTLPALVAPCPLLDGLDGAGTTLGLVLDAAHGQGINALPEPAGGCSLLVGPEGGLSPREASAAAARGFHGLALGPRVLRTETAGIAALAALQARWGDMA